MAAFASFVATSNKHAVAKPGHVMRKQLAHDGIWMGTKAFTGTPPKKMKHMGRPVGMPKPKTNSFRIIQHSGKPGAKAVPAPSGFVSTVFRAHQQHHKLELRPDDIAPSMGARCRE